MAYKALYRTYRPSTFEEVAGQQHIVKTIKNALATNKIAHAYLFAGPRGTGKTTMAKLLAKALNCDEGFGKQCNECKNCQAIMDGTHPDVLELDAASNNGVDNIRELIDNVKYGTILGRYKVYIIDEVHMLSTGAFNALLKTLEEPPSNVIFILATTEPHKVLPTILSRCQRYDFSKVSEEDIKNRIRYVLLKEGIEFNNVAVNLIVRLADGGMRDALSILDQVLAYSGNKLEEADILNIFALESKEEKLELLKSIIENDMYNVMGRLKKYIDKGTDLKRLTDDLLVILKDVLIYKTTRNTNFLQELSEVEVKALSNSIDEESTLKLIDVLLQATKDFKNVSSIAPIFEISLLKMATVKNGETEVVVPKIKPVLKEEKPVEKVVEKEAPKVTVNESKNNDVPIKKHEVKKTIIFAGESGDNPFEKADETALSNSALKSTLIEIEGTNFGDHYEIPNETLLKLIVLAKKDLKVYLSENWQKLKRYTAHPSLSKAASLLIDGHPLVASEKFLILEYAMSSYASRINLTNVQADLQRVIETVFGKRLFVYALNRSQSVDVQNLFKHKYQAGNLPKKDEIEIKFIGD